MVFRNERDKGWMIVRSEWPREDKEQKWAWLLSLSENRPERIQKQER